MNWWKLASLGPINFDNFKELMPEIARQVMSDPAVLNGLENTGSINMNDVIRILGCEPVMARVIIPRLQDYYYNSPQVKAYNDKQKLRRDDDYLYHVTTFRNLPSIKTQGLVPNGAGGTNFEGWYEGHSRGKIFLCARGGVDYWMGKIEEAEENKKMNYRGYRPSKVVVVRVKKSDVLGAQEGGPGSSDSRNACVFVTSPIPASKIEIVRNFTS